MWLSQLPSTGQSFMTTQVINLEAEKWDGVFSSVCLPTSMWFGWLQNFAAGKDLWDQLGQLLPYFMHEDMKFRKVKQHDLDPAAN